MFIISLLIILQIVPVQASDNQIRVASNSYKQGDYIYYCTNKGIERLNIKTGNHGLFISDKYKGQDTNGFRDLNIKDNYIYCTYDLQLGTTDNIIYVYKIGKNGDKKKLDSGHSPLVVGNWIYYVKSKFITEFNFTYQEDIGIYKMKLDGSSKTKVSNYPYIMGVTKSKLLVYKGSKIKSIDLKNNKIQKEIWLNRAYTTGNWSDTWQGAMSVGERVYTYDEKRITYKTGTYETGIAYEAPNGTYIREYDVLGGWIIVRAISDGGEYNSCVYAIKMNGTKKILLAKWWDV